MSKHRNKVTDAAGPAPSRHTAQGTRHLNHGANVSDTHMVGTNVAGESPFSRYLPDLKDYAWRGLSNPAAARLQAKLDELGVK